jgi:sulfur carrier protein ThiS/predicted N-acetyltransferase YhbS
MPVTVEVVGSETQTCVVADDATYADLIRTAGYPPQETTILVDGTPVPGDATVDTNRVRLLRLIQGGGDTEVRKQISTNARTDTTESLPTGVSIEPATPADRLDIVRVLDAAMLQTDVSALAERIAVDAVICARFERTGAVVGAVVVTRPATDTAHIDALAVRRARRGNGIGSALVDCAVAAASADPAVGRVTVGFDDALTSLYTDCGFDIAEDGAADRWVGWQRVDIGHS